MKITTIKTYMDIQNYTIEKCNFLKKELHNELLNDDDAAADFLHSNALIIAAKKNLEELTEKLQIAEEIKNVQE